MSKPETLELAKIICDTSYLGWLVNYAQISNVIAKEHDVNYDEMWEFSDEIHKILGNRPKFYPGFIGGHCVIPNLELIHNETLNLINSLNNSYLKKVKNIQALFIDNYSNVSHIITQERGKSQSFGNLGIIYAILTIGILGFVV